MLKPFRIRNLYLNASDLFDCSGVIQLSSQQYEQEIQLTPEAALAYLDEDDGETITIGSSFELEQRLLEPPGRFSSWNGQLATDDPPPLHVFDIKHSNRVASTWRKYAIHYTQPSSMSRPARASGPGRETRQRDDYQSLLAKIQVLELEVRLLKEAFRMHTNVSPARPDAQRPVFAAAYKNSDMSAQNPPSTAHVAPSIAKPAPSEATKPCLQYPPLNRLHQPELHANRQNGKEVDDVPHSSPVGLRDALAASLRNKEFFDSWRFEQPKSVSANLQTRQWDNSDRTVRFRPWLPETTDAARDKPVSCETGWGKAAGELNDFQKLEVESQKLPTPAAVEDQSTKTKSTPPCVLRTTTYPESTSSIARPLEAQQSSSKSLMDLEPEAEIARFPTIFQLEKEGLQSVKGKSSTGPALGHSSASLARANTVTSSNPAARLLKPFDPATEGFGVPFRQFHLPRRSGTEQYRRRPHPEQFTLWEEFERSAMPETSTTALGFARSQGSRPADVNPSRTPSSVNRSQSLAQHRPLVRQQSHSIAPMRSTLVLAGTTHNCFDRTTLEQPQPCCEAVTGTADPVVPRATDRNQELSPRIQTCIRSLQEMGCKPPSRLPVYAAACGGNVSKAMAMAEEDEKATQETREICENAGIANCVKQLKEMGYNSGYGDEELKRFARDAGGNAEIVVEKLETPSTREIDEWRQRLRDGLREGGGMPGSFP